MSVATNRGSVDCACTHRIICSAVACESLLSVRGSSCSLSKADNRRARCRGEGRNSIHALETLVQVDQFLLLGGRKATSRVMMLRLHLYVIEPT